MTIILCNDCQFISGELANNRDLVMKKKIYRNLLMLVNVLKSKKTCQALLSRM